MEAHGLIHRELRKVSGNAHLSNIYHLEGLIIAAKPFAQEMTEHIEKKAADRAALRAKKGKPNLKVVKEEE